MIHPNWAFIGTIVTILVFPLLAYIHTQLSKKVDEATKELKQVNGRIVKLETWSKLHDEADERRFAALERDILDVKG